MTNPQEPSGPNAFGGNPFGGAPYGGMPPGPPIYTAPPPQRPRTNIFATMSVVFAFAFAPAGAVLGHLSLKQIRRSGERGRDRAIVGLMLSYAVITLTVVAVVAWASQTDSGPSRTASPTSRAASTTSAPSSPMVTPTGLPGLLPTIDDVKRFMGIPNLVALPPTYKPGPDSDSASVDRPECWPVMGGGAPNSDMQALVGYYGLVLIDDHDVPALKEAGQVVMAFRDPPAAQRQLTNLVSIWRKCGGSTMNILPPPGKQSPPVAVTMGVPSDAGNGITVMVLTTQGPAMRSRNDRAIVAKNNVVVDINVVLVDTDRGEQAALDIANYILGKIPS
ncbi:MAG: sensor domain-containing protein [Actinomycetota bacterium]|nr:sensor domain-containing protein [Actinomycetota bacterium]